MQFTFSTLFSLSLVAASMAHMDMVDPAQWNSNSSPLDPSGSDFPCQLSYEGLSDIQTPRATWTSGQDASFQVAGGATHGGGSGQMVITYDLPPNANSVWHVLHSWEGNHPVEAEGNTSGDPKQPHPPISFKVPEGLREGKATVAWNWYNRIGNREHYMKCSTVQINSSGGETYESLPTAFRANSGNGCIVPEGTVAIDFGIKDPQLVTIAPGAEPQPIACGGGGGGSTSTGGDSGSEETPDAPAPTPTPVPEEDENTESGSGESEELPNKPTAPAATPSPSPVTQPEQPEQENKGTATGGACTEGETVCTDGNTWSQCGSGIMQNMGLVPAGLKCEGGKLIAKRSIRFSAEHRRHRVRHV